MMLSVQRSMLILPVNVPRFVEKAHVPGSDAVVLDLEDAVAPSEKENARKMVEDSIQTAARGGADVLVRINNEQAMLDEDLDAAVHEGLHGIFLPKVESALQVVHLEERIAELEAARGIEPGRIKISLHIESPCGLLNIQEIATASPRTESMSLGVDDYCLELGVEPTREAIELLFPFSMLVIASRAADINPMGILGTVAEYKKLEIFENAAIRARKLGSVGAYCIHPNQVPILNRIFSPTEDEIRRALRVVTAFEQSLGEGRASGSLDGRMIDIPVYKRAKKTLQRAEVIEQRGR